MDSGLRYGGGGGGYGENGGGGGSGAPDSKRSRMAPIGDPTAGYTGDDSSPLGAGRQQGAPPQQQQQQQQQAAQRQSKVVHVRGLPDQLSEADLMDACAQFGSINYVSLTGRGTALVEFESQRSSEECVAYNSSTDIFVLQKPAYFAFAPMDEIPRRGMETSKPMNVLAMQVLNARYPVTVEVMSAILKSIAQCQRVSILRRASTVVLVEFRDADTARNVKHRLNGCDIYSGCCTLKIEYANLMRLNVTRNDDTQWDYTGTPSGQAMHAGGCSNVGRDRYVDRIRRAASSDFV